jgi:hypothetical protein
VSLGRPAFGFDDRRPVRWLARALAVLAVAQLLGFVARGADKPGDPIRVPVPSASTTAAP